MAFKAVYRHNNNYFSNLTIENCYWAGFIAADGSVNKNKRIFTVSLAHKDKEHLDLLKNALEYTGTLKEVETKLKNKVYKSHKLYICCAEKILQDLENLFNIVENKSLSLKPPNLNNSELIKAFIIGYIDGDGSIVFGKYGKNKYLRLSILGTEKFLNWVSDFFMQEFNLKGSKNVYRHKNIYAYQVTANKASKILFGLKNTKVPKLSRKWDKIC